MVPAYTFEYLKSSRIADGKLEVVSANVTMKLFPSDDMMMLGKKRRDKAMVERFRFENGGEMPLFRMTIEE